MSQNGLIILIISIKSFNIELRTHSYEYVPFMIYDSRKSISNHNQNTFNEKTVIRSDLVIEDGFTLLGRFLKD